MKEVDAPVEGVVTPDAVISNHLELEPLIQRTLSEEDGLPQEWGGVRHYFRRGVGR